MIQTANLLYQYSLMILPIMNLFYNNGDVSDSSSTNDVNNLLEDIDSLSDIIEGEPDQNSENGDTPPGLDPDDDLCVDLDNLANDTRSPDDMYNILNIDPEWTQDFSDIHVKQFTGPVRPNLGPDFDTSVATPLDYFQLFFLMKCFSEYVTILTSSNNSIFSRNRSQH